MSRLIRIADNSDGMSEAVSLSITYLQRGNVIVVPTDTVYGLAALSADEQAVERIYRIKGRAFQKPLVLQVTNTAVARNLIRGWDQRWDILTEVFWPGALTIIGIASEFVPPWILRGGRLVGLRCPDHQLLLNILEGCNAPLAITSANQSGFSEATNVAEVVAALGSAADLILDGGENPLGVVSTVISLAELRPQVLRRGAIPESVLEEALSIKVQERS